MPDEIDYEKLDKSGMAGGYYHSCVTDREPYLVRARRISELTIPTLFRSQGAGGSDDVIIPWNSIGAYCNANLASALVFTMFPSGRSGFLLEQAEQAAIDLEQLPEEQRAQIKEAIEKGLSRIEQDTTKAIAADGDRAKMFVAALRLLIGGNHAFQFYDDATMRGIPLERYVVTRDAQGTVLKFCIRDDRDWDDLPEDVEEGLLKLGVKPPKPDPSGRRPVCIYTHGRLDDGKYEVRQEVLGMAIPGTEYTRDKDALDFLFLPWLLLDEEHYGRSYCEFYEGDLLTAEGLTKSLGEGAAAAARFITLVNPTGLTNKKQLAAARNGDTISGRESDVSVLKAEKGGDFMVGKNTLDDGLQRLGKAFLLNSSVQRSGERVTAEEIRYMAGELEKALGGVYAQQEITWQTPYYKRKLKLLQKAKRVTALPEGTVSMTITAGQASLARNQEITQLRTGASILAETFGAEALPQFLKPNKFAMRIWNALGVDTDGLVPTDEELAQQKQQEQMMAMAQSMGPQALQQVGNNITSNQVAQTAADAKVATAASTQGTPSNG